MIQNIYESDLLHEMQGGSMHPGGLRLTSRAAKLADLKSGMHVVDIGCGIGATSAHLKKKLGLNVVGLELSDELVNIGLKKYSGLKLIRWDCGQIPLEDGSIDAILAECSLSVIGNTESVLRQCHHALKASGVMIITDICMKTGNDGPPYTQEGLLKCVQDAGFEVYLKEDHTQALRTYYAELVEHGVVEAGGKPGDCTFMNNHVKKGGGLTRLTDLEYWLIIARKITTNNWSK
jgi:ubiquinone/menaquinone biosynthesis C-methylase UbiE